jgi:hypothetical protein
MVPDVLGRTIDLYSGRDSCVSIVRAQHGVIANCYDALGNRLGDPSRGLRRLLQFRYESRRSCVSPLRCSGVRGPPDRVCPDLNLTGLLLLAYKIEHRCRCSLGLILEPYHIANATTFLQPWWSSKSLALPLSTLLVSRQS